MANGRNSSRRRRPQLTGPKSVSFYADTSGIDGISDYLSQLGEGVRDAIRPVAQAGAQVFYNRVKLNVSTMGKVSGNLDRAIYQAYMKEASTEGKSAFYRVSWNVNKAPHGRLLEWGWIQRYAAYFKDGRWYTNKNKPLASPIQHPGKAFIRRAESVRGEAQEGMRQELANRLEALFYYGA